MKSNQRVNCELSQIKKIKPLEQQVADRLSYMNKETSPEINAGVRDFMDAQVQNCFSGNKVQSRLAINRISLFNNSPDQLSRNPYLQSNGGVVRTQVFEQNESPGIFTKTVRNQLTVASALEQKRRDKKL